MDQQHTEVKEFLLDLPSRGEKVTRRATVAGLAVLLFGGLWLGYSFYEVQKWKTQSLNFQAESERLQGEITQKSEELEKKNEELKEAAKLGNISSDDLFLLKNIVPGLTDNRYNGTPLNQILAESRNATTELQNFFSPRSEINRRSRITIRFFTKEVDQKRIIRAIETLKKEYGFQAEEGPPTILATPSNSISLVNMDLTADDVKLIAYNFIRVGVQIKYIGPDLNRARLKNSEINTVVRIPGITAVSNDPPLTVEQIRGMTLEQMKDGTKHILVSTPKNAKNPKKQRRNLPTN